MTEPEFPYLKEVIIGNLKSFGSTEPKVQLGALNIIIGANGSGKSNFLKCLKVMTSIENTYYNKKFQNIFENGLKNWIWKGWEKVTMPDPLSICVLDFKIKSGDNVFHHRIRFDENENYPRFVSEFIGQRKDDNFVFRFDRTNIDQQMTLSRDNRVVQGFNHISFSQSVLEVFSDPENYPEFKFLQDYYSKTYFCDEWKFGGNNEFNRSQSPNYKSNFLFPDGRNLAVFFEKLLEKKPIKAKIFEYLKDFYEPFNDEFRNRTQNGGIDMVIEERDFERPTPHFMLSDGTQRFFFLLALLLDPSPPPLICIEEPELGMHPDVIPLIAKLLKDASTRTQVIVTTHSKQLVDEFGEEPECIQVCERYNGSTTITRLNKDDLNAWLENYSLGHLWVSGHLGGNRW